MTPSGMAEDSKPSSGLVLRPRRRAKGAMRQAKVISVTTTTATAI